MNSYLSHIVRFLISVIATVASASAQDVTGDECRNWRDAHPAWLWCDDFESKAPLEARYREFQSDGGAFRRTTKDSRHGRAALKATWKEGDVRAGSLMQTFGRNPIGSQIRHGLFHGFTLIGIVYGSKRANYNFRCLTALKVWYNYDYDTTRIC